MSLESLKKTRPFIDPDPAVKKDFNRWGEPDGWCHGNNRKMFRQLITPDTRIIVDGGSWKGQSAWILAGLAPQAHIICIDTWTGSLEHIKCMPDALPILYDTFLANMAEIRDRIIPIRADWKDGLGEMLHHGVCPDIVYIDWNHEEAAVTEQLEYISTNFPKAQICGDDWTWPGVRNAVQGFAARTGMQISSDYSCWQLKETRI